MLTKNLHGLNRLKLQLHQGCVDKTGNVPVQLSIYSNREKIYDITHIRVSFIIVVSPKCTNGSTTIRQFMMKTHIVCNMYYLGRKICKTI